MCFREMCNTFGALRYEEYGIFYKTGGECAFIWCVWVFIPVFSRIIPSDSRESFANHSECVPQDVRSESKCVKWYIFSCGWFTCRKMVVYVSD